MIEPGEIYFIRSGQTKTTGCEIWPDRPGVVISSEAAVACSGTVNIVYLTSSPRPKAFGVPVPETAFYASDRKYDNHTALCAQITAVDKSRLGNFLGRVSKATMMEIAGALAAANLDGAIPVPQSPRRKKTQAQKAR